MYLHQSYGNNPICDYFLTQFVQASSKPIESITKV